MIFNRSKLWWLSRIEKEPDTPIGAGVGEHPLMLRAYEVVHHEADCPSIGGAGDKDCRCDAVPFLNDLRATLSPRPAVGAQTKED